MTYEQFNVSVKAHYFLVKIVSGKLNFQDPDKLIHDISWKCVDEIKSLELSFPEDREFLITYITNEIQSSNATCGFDDFK